MPVQINEMIIRANITEAKEKEKSAPEPSRATNNEEIIKECVEKVMELLNSKHSR